MVKMIGKVKNNFQALFPTLFSFVRHLYWKISGLQMCLFGTKIEEKRWVKRPLSEIEKGFGSQDHPRRLFLVKALEAFDPVSSVLEIGCGFGPNLYVIAKSFPNAMIRGIDINPKSVQIGNEWFTKENILNVKLLVGKADELKQLQNKSFDIVFTDALLIYIGADKIDSVIKEMFRITRRALIFIELHDEHLKKYACFYDHGNWKRNYVDLLKKYVSKDSIYLTKLPKELWPEEPWLKQGFMIRVIME
jgi:ubiquinone/menaquinone biosynthesis C-methylase UbiE